MNSLLAEFQVDAYIDSPLYVEIINYNNIYTKIQVSFRKYAVDLVFEVQV